MALTPRYGSRELVKCLLILGFTLNRKQAGTSHIKYTPPLGIQIKAGERSFIMVQMGIKTYDTNACNRYIKQIKDFGFKEQEILNGFK